MSCELFTEHDWLLFIFMVFTFPSVGWVFRQVIMILSQLERTQPYHLSRRLVHRVANPNTGLSDWAARQDIRHDPPMMPAVASLHAPRPLWWESFLVLRIWMPSLLMARPRLWFLFCFRLFACVAWLVRFMSYTVLQTVFLSIHAHNMVIEIHFLERLVSHVNQVTKNYCI